MGNRVKTVSVHSKLAKLAECEGKTINRQRPPSPPENPNPSNPQYVNVSCLGINKKVYG